MTFAADGITEDEYEDIVPAYEYATDVTTTAGEDLPYVGGSASESDFEPEQRLAGFSIRNPAAHWRKMMWCIARRARTELVHLPDVEIADAVIASLEERTATETASTELAQHGEMVFETLSSKYKAFSPSELTPALEPVRARTPLGRRLREIRRRIEASGAPLLDWDGIDRERKERRGEPNSE